MNRLKSSKGFTLLEVLIALIIIAGGIMVLANSWSGNFMRVRKGQILNNVATLLERKMIEIEAEYKEKPFNEIPESDGGDFGSDFPQYSWKLESRDLEFPDLSAFIIGQGEGADEMLLSMLKQVTEYLSKSIKEVKVTISVKGRAAKPLNFSATQYFVNYEGDFAAAAGVPSGDAGGGGTNQ